MTAFELDDIERLAAESSPGVWMVGHAVRSSHQCLNSALCHNVWSELNGEPADVTHACARLDLADAAFIAAAHQAVPRLVAEVRRLRGELYDADTRSMALRAEIDRLRARSGS